MFLPLDPGIQLLEIYGNSPTHQGGHHNIICKNKKKEAN